MLPGDHPGVCREDFEVRIDDGFLVVRGERVDEDKADAGRIWQERPTGKCAGACRLPEEANYAGGVLELPVPEREARRLVTAGADQLSAGLMRGRWRDAAPDSRLEPSGSERYGLRRQSSS